MKKILSFVLLLSIMITSLVSFTSCSEKDVNEGYITDEQREEHILTLIGDSEIIAENVKTETTEIDDTGMEIVKTEEEWVIAKKYDNTVGSKNSVVDGIRRGNENMTLILENDNFELYMDLTYKTDQERMSAICIVDKNTGHVYHSDPYNFTGTYSNGKGVEPEVFEPIVSPIALEAYDVSNKRYEFNYMQHCADSKRLTITKVDDDTIRVIYTIGNDPDSDLVPPVVTMETWEWIKTRLEKQDGGESQYKKLWNCYKSVTPDGLTLEDKERFIDDYPTIEMFPMMIVRTLNVRQKMIVKESMEMAGFNADMLKKEMDAVEYSGPARAVMYTIPVDLTLTEEGLSVTVDSNLILAPQKQKMYKIYLYRTLGAIMPVEVGSKILGTKDKIIQNDQYIIIPDGSGAIMPIAGDLTKDVYTGRVYGLDDTFQVEYDITPEEQVVTPFLAFDRSTLGGMVAILSNGGAQAYASARPSNTTNNPTASINYDLVYAERSYLTYSGGQGGSEEISGSTKSDDTSSAGAILSKEDNIAVFTVDYFFTKGDMTYSEYAEFYRDYLIEHEILPASLKSDSSVPFYVDLLGAINKTESVVGVPVDHVVALTTYNQVKEIADALLAEGVENINFRYLYWANDGYYNTIFDGADPVSVLGSKSELKSVSEALQSSKIGFYPDANFIYVVKDEAFDSMNYSQDAARRLDMTVARDLERDYATGYIWKSGFDKTVIAPDKIPNLAAGFKSDLENLVSNKQISLGDIGSVINSNYKIGRIKNRTQALEYHIQAIETFDGYDMMVQTGNDYTWKYASHILNLPMGSSQYMSTSEAIPFIQMVLHGYIDYASSPLNESADYSTAILEMLETGSGVYFKWMGADNSILNNTDYVFQDWYSVNYKDSFDIAVELYKEISGLMNKVANKPMTAHEILEAYHVYDGERTYYAEGDENYVDGELNASYNRIPTSGVYATTYGDSVKFIVNYNDYDVELADETTVIPAKGYLEVKVK